MFVCVCVCVRVCVRAYVRACVRRCVRMRACSNLSCGHRCIHIHSNICIGYNSKLVRVAGKVRNKG